CLVEPAVYLLELLLEAPGLFSVPVAAAVVGVDNDQLGRAQLGLGCCAAQCRAAFWFGNVSDDDGHLISWVRDRRWTKSTYFPGSPARCVVWLEHARDTPFPHPHLFTRPFYPPVLIKTSLYLMTGSAADHGDPGPAAGPPAAPDDNWRGAWTRTSRYGCAARTC